MDLTAGPAPFDLVVVGSGVSGLAASLTAAPLGRVALVTKGGLEDGCTRYAQGGLAAALGEDDSPDLHFADTVAAGRGLCDEAAVRVLVDSARDAVESLLEWGVQFDTEDGQLLLGQEAAHSRRRIVHAHGDGTGLAMETALAAKVRASSCQIFEGHVVDGLLFSGGRCAGVCGTRAVSGEAFAITGRTVLLASGGAGRLWGNTTNPESATGDGVSLAYEAGAEVGSMEFVQFHPTALHLEGAPRFLVSEAVRGEGAHVVNRAGKRFLFDSDDRGELAPRDAVSRAIWNELAASGEDSVFMDCRPIGDRLPGRFPAISEKLRTFGLDMATDLIPIAPAAHFLMGGVRTDLYGRTTVPGLFASGEVASTGVHGANRLASNSLLESVVFAERAATAALAESADVELDLSELPERVTLPPVPERSVDGVTASRKLLSEIGDVMWEGVGLVRSRDSIERALARLEQMEEDPEVISGRLVAPLRTAEIICHSALLRQETRGSHVREEFPTTSEEWRGIVVASKERGVSFDRYA